ncbi:hypothetical protein DH2020_005802 [Rehmannia glutinosa]|uniref:DNA-directed RNA polymerase subunit beta n=1 Tax=Rehmannia glutinosa TaxID=99300 RepID=A0ABR0XHL1_REHGL
MDGRGVVDPGRNRREVGGSKEMRLGSRRIEMRRAASPKPMSYGYPLERSSFKVKSDKTQQRVEFGLDGQYDKSSVTIKIFIEPFIFFNGPTDWLEHLADYLIPGTGHISLFKENDRISKNNLRLFNCGVGAYEAEVQKRKIDQFFLNSFGSSENGLDIDKQALAAPVKNAVEKFQLLPEFLKVRGLVKQHLDSFNYFVRTQIKKIVQANDLITSRIDPSIYLRYKDVGIGTPSLLCCTNIREHRIYYRKPWFKDDPNEGECPLDPGGYFVIKGTEKWSSGWDIGLRLVAGLQPPSVVILIQEQLSKNRIIIDADKKGCVQASVMSSTEATKSKTVIRMEKEKIYLYLNQFATKVPIMIVLKAMGMESDQEVVQMIGRDPRYSELLLPSIEDCVKEAVHTQYQALEFLEQKVKKLPYSTTYEKDYVGNKRLELSGQMLSLLFEDLFKTMNDEARKKLDSTLAKAHLRKRFDVSQFEQSMHITDRRKEYAREMTVAHTSTNVLRRLLRNCFRYLFSASSQCVYRKDSITVGLERSLSTGNWDVKRFRMHRKGMTQVVARLSYIGTLGHMTKISPQFEKSRKVSGPRALQPSQWGMLCPCDTPEGEACGLVKNLALMTHVTTDEDEGPLISLCFSLGVEDLELLSGEELHMPNSYLIIFNGLILGKHRRPQKFANAMRKLRRAGKIGEFVSIFVNEKQRCVYIASDGGRVCRPLVIADKGVSRIKEHHMKELKDGVRTFDSFLKEGLIEYLDVNEENNALIALYEENAKEGTTHIEIEPFTILGVVAGLIPYPHHNQSPRNTYQCAMGKQAMGNIAYNQASCFVFVHYDKLGAGQNATVAVMSYSGYDIEDAIVMNKSSLDRGFGRCIIIYDNCIKYLPMNRMSAVSQKYVNGTSDRIIRPDKGNDAEQILDDDGLAAPGQIIRNMDVYIKKQSPKITRGPVQPRADLADSAYTSSKQTYKGPEGETPVVDRVVLCSDRNNNLCIKFMIRHTRRPEVGDKFSSRHGQKGVCGTIVQQEDFPFSERGICPDLIMNPHGFPSRMTVGKMIELLGSKAGVSCGRFHYGSAFGEPSGHADKVETISETLVKHGFSYNGKDFIYSGGLKGVKDCDRNDVCGKRWGFLLIMRPRKVLDKMHARGSGPRVMITRQPTEGRSRNGGLRVGEMERDCLIAYGASMLIYERLMISSDPFEVQSCQSRVLDPLLTLHLKPFRVGARSLIIDFIYGEVGACPEVCRKCGLLGYYNFKLKTGICSTCKNGENISTMKLPYACKLLFQLGLINWRMEFKEVFGCRGYSSFKKVDMFSAAALGNHYQIIFPFTLAGSL